MKQQIAYNINSRVQEQAEDRLEHRKKVLKRGMIGFGNQYASQPCVVRDMTSHGAKIELQNIIALPKEFKLHIEIDGIQLDCNLVWQKPPFAGVVFIGESKPTNLAREQVVRMADAALSPEFMEEFERRQAAEHRNQPAESTYSRSAARIRRAAIKPKPFGKRCFKENE